MPEDNNAIVMPNSPVFTAGRVTELTGLTYRQINDWDARAGVMDSGRNSKEGWRKFSLLDVLALCLCAELRNELQLPLEKVGYVYRWLVAPREFDLDADQTTIMVEAVKQSFRASHPNSRMPSDEVLVGMVAEDCKISPIQAAVESMESGEPHYLYSNFSTSMICTEAQFKLLFSGHMAVKPSVLYLINPSLNRALKKMDLRPTAFRRMEPAAYIAKIKAAAEAQNILELIHSGDYHTVTLHRQNGRIIRADCTESIPRSEAKRRAKQILEAVEAGDFSTVTVQKADGHVVGLERKTVVKFAK